MNTRITRQLRHRKSSRTSGGKVSGLLIIVALVCLGTGFVGGQMASERFARSEPDDAGREVGEHQASGRAVSRPQLNPENRTAHGEPDSDIRSKGYLPPTSLGTELASLAVDKAISQQISTLQWIGTADPDALKRWLIAAELDGGYDYVAIKIAINRLVDLDLATALELTDHSSWAVSRYLSPVIARIAANNLPLALSTLESLPVSRREEAARGIIEGSPISDPAAWIVLGEQLAEFFPNDAAMNLWTIRTVRNDPYPAFEILQAKLAAGDASQIQRQRLNGFATVWLMEDPDLAMDTIRQMPESSREELIATFEQNGLPTVNPERGLKQLLHQPDSTFDRLIPQTLANYASDNPVEAIDLAQSLAPDLRLKSIDAAVRSWGWKDPDAASAWIFTHADESDWKRHIESIASSYRFSNPEKAELWLESLESAQLRDAAKAVINKHYPSAAK